MKCVLVVDGKICVVDEENGWVTLKNGVRIQLGENGNIEKGPSALQGKNIKEIKETPLQRMKRWENERVDKMKEIAKGGKYNALVIKYPNGKSVTKYYESGRWTDKKPTGLAVTHGGYQYKPYEMEMK